MDLRARFYFTIKVLILLDLVALLVLQRDPTILGFNSTTANLVYVSPCCARREIGLYRLVRLGLVGLSC